MHPPFQLPAALSLLMLPALLLGAVVSGAPEARAAFGKLTMLRGEARVLREGREIRVTARIDLEHGDRVRTLSASKGHIRLASPLKGAEAVLTAETTVRVNELGRRTARAGAASPFRLFFGALRSRVARYLFDAPFVRTDTSTTGIKGTDFIVFVRRREATEFIGVDGLIEARSVSRPEFSLRIGRRQWGEIVAEEKPKPPIRVPDELWESALREFSFPSS